MNAFMFTTQRMHPGKNLGLIQPVVNFFLNACLSPDSAAIRCFYRLRINKISRICKKNIDRVRKVLYKREGEGCLRYAHLHLKIYRPRADVVQVLTDKTVTAHQRIISNGQVQKLRVRSRLFCPYFISGIFPCRQGKTHL